jgi:hypothetical protein
MSDHSLNRQYDVYAAAREEYRQKIDEQAARIAQLEAKVERGNKVLRVLTEWLDGGHEWSDDPAWLRAWVEGDEEAMQQADDAIARAALGEERT